MPEDEIRNRLTRVEGKTTELEAGHKYLCRRVKDVEDVLKELRGDQREGFKDMGSKLDALKERRTEEELARERKATATIERDSKIIKALVGLLAAIMMAISAYFTFRTKTG